MKYKISDLVIYNNKRATVIYKFFNLFLLRSYYFPFTEYRLVSKNKVKEYLYPLEKGDRIRLTKKLPLLTEGSKGRIVEPRLYDQYLIKFDNLENARTVLDGSIYPQDKLYREKTLKDIIIDAYYDIQRNFIYRKWMKIEKQNRTNV